MSDFRHQWRAALTADDSPASSTARLTGLMVADFANRETGIAFPAAKTLGRRARFDERTIRRALEELVGLGYLLPTKARGKVTRYLLTTPEVRAARPHSLRADGPHSNGEVWALRPGSAGAVSGSAGRAPDEPRKREGEEPRAPARATLALESSLHALGAKSSPAGECTRCGEQAAERFAIYETAAARTIPENSDEPYLTLHRPTATAKRIDIECLQCLETDAAEILELADLVEAGGNGHEILDHPADAVADDIDWNST